MAFKHYDVVRAASPSDLAEKLTHKLKEGWQPYGGPVAITPYTLMQAVAIEGDPQVGPSSEPDWFYVVVLAGQSNGMAYGEGLPLTGTGNPFLMSFFTQTTDGKLNLMHHKKAGNTKLGEFGNYSNDWQTLELVFTAGSATVTPKLNGVAGPAFQVIKDSLTVGLNALTLTDITKNATYGVEIESLVLEINAPVSS